MKIDCALVRSVTLYLHRSRIVTTINKKHIDIELEGYLHLSNKKSKEFLEKKLFLLNCKAAACRYRIRLTHICYVRTHILFLNRQKPKGIEGEMQEE